jgi:hypothetical protein
MSEFDSSTIEWLEPWYELPPDQAKALVAELQSELCSGHVLFRKTLKALGRRQDCDDALFLIEESPPRLAVVHLTFQYESNPTWPKTAFFTSLRDWIERCMIPDAEFFN